MPTRLQILRKDQLLSDLITTRQKILAEATKHSDEQRDQVFLGIWSIKDLLAHLIGWDHTNVDAIKSVLQGQVPAFYKHHDRDWQTYNAMLVKKHRKESFQNLLAALKDSHERLVEFVKTIAPEHFTKDFGVRFRGYKVTIQRLLEAECKDEQIHLQQINDFFKESR